MKTSKRHFLSLLVAAILLSSVTGVFAADVTWLNTATDSFWTNSVNWGAGVPTSSDFALFNTGGNGFNTIDLSHSTTATVYGLKFGQAATPSYTIGAGGAGAQDLIVTQGKFSDMYGAVTNNQIINANLHMDSGASSSGYTFNNYSTDADLIINGNFYRTGGNYVDYLRIQQAGTTEIAGSLVNSSSSGDLDVVVDASNLRLSGGGGWDGDLRVKNNGTVTVTETGTIAGGNLDIQGGSVTVNSDQTVAGNLLFGDDNQGGDATLNIADGKTLTLLKNSTYYPRDTSGATNNTALVTGGTLDLGGVNRTINVNDNTLVDAGTAELTIQSDIENAGKNIVKAYGGTLKLDADNYNYSQLLINKGRVQITSDAALGSANQTKVGNGSNTGELEYLFDTDTTLSPGQISIGDGGATEASNARLLNNGAGKVTMGWNYVNSQQAGVTVDRTLYLGGTNTLDNDAKGLRDLNGSQSIHLVKEDSGKWKFSLTSTYTGTTTVEDGILQFDKRLGLYNNTPASWTAANLTVKDGATLALRVGGSVGFTSANLDTLLALGGTTGGFEDGSTAGLHTGLGDFTYGSVIADPNSGANALGLRKMGGNILKLTGNNTYTGPTVVEQGYLQIGDQGSSGDITSDVQIEDGAFLRLRRNDAYTFDQAISGEGRLEVYVDDNAGLTTLTEANTHSGGTALREGKLAITDSDALGTGEFLMRDDGVDPKLYLNTDGLNVTNNIRISNEGDVKQIAADQSAVAHRVEISGDIAIEETTLGNFQLKAASPGSGNNVMTVSGDISGVGGVEKTGWDTLILSGNNTYSGGTKITDGELQVGDNGTTGNLPGDVSFKGGTGGDALHFARSDTYTYAGTISGDGEVMQMGDGAENADYEGEVLELSGNNSYTGGTKINAETRVRAAHNNALGTGDVTLQGQDAGLLLADSVNIGNNMVMNNTSARNHLEAEGDATYSGNIAINNNNEWNFHLRAADNKTLTVSGDISGSGGLVMTRQGSGGGTVILSGTNTYSGKTRLSAGGNTLQVDGDSSGATGDVKVDFGTLSGDGTIGGAVTVGQSGYLAGNLTFLNAVTVGGYLRPGNSPGSMTFEGDVLLEDTSETTFEITSVSVHDYIDGVDDTGNPNTLTLASGADIIIDLSNAVLAQNDFVDLIGNFDTITDNGAIVTILGTDASNVDTSTLFTDGKIQALAAIPEPAVAGLMILAGLGAMILRRVKRISI